MWPHLRPFDRSFKSIEILLFCQVESSNNFSLKNFSSKFGVAELITFQTFVRKILRLNFIKLSNIERQAIPSKCLCRNEIFETALYVASPKFICWSHNLNGVWFKESDLQSRNSVLGWFWIQHFWTPKQKLGLQEGRFQIWIFQIVLTENILSISDYENSLSSRLLFSRVKLENAVESASNLAHLLLSKKWNVRTFLWKNIFFYFCNRLCSDIDSLHFSSCTSLHCIEQYNTKVHCGALQFTFQHASTKLKLFSAPFSITLRLRIHGWNCNAHGSALQ